MAIPPKMAAKIMISILALFITKITSDPNTKVLSVLCNSGEYSKGDPFGISLAFVVEELEDSTPKSKNYNYYNISPYPNAFAFGHAACNQNLTTSDCRTCLAAAKTAMFSSCPNRIGSRSVLQDCTIRYEQYPFDD
ncbi:antifungal protein ginkbilobin-like protein [Mercurialis annua]|uniref:antifungal protein ginkbilobin-like protein n=1 Tax=Mercurialis annua TaxID=3986 RepID=UPI0021604077|nr:antifungal protein ginkbilobin-like protein [Mercurialis annua]